MFIWFPGISVCLLLTLFCINVLDRFSREQQARSLAPSVFSSFPLLSSPRVNYSRTCPADRPTPPPAHFHESRCFRSRVRNRYYRRNTSAGDAGPLDLPFRRSDRTRSLRRNLRRPEKALPLPHAIDWSLDRYTADFLSSEHSHWIQDDPAMFHRFPLAIVSAVKKETKGRKKEEIWSSENSEILFRLFFFLSFIPSATNSQSTWITRGRRLAPRLFPGEDFFHAGGKTEFRKGRVLAEPPPVRCRRRVATVVSSNAQPASGLPVPSPSSRPSGTDYTQFTDLCYYRTVFHPLRPMLFIHPLASPFFSEFHIFSKSRRAEWSS